MYIVVSFETGVRWGLASSALVQRAKLQRHFLGASLKRGNRGECCALLLGDSSSVCCLSSTTHTCAPALRFHPPGDINMYTLNTLPNPMCYSLGLWWQTAGHRAAWNILHAVLEEGNYIPKIPLCCFILKKPPPICCVFQMAFKHPSSLMCRLRREIRTNTCRVTVGGWDHTLNLDTVWKSRKRGFLCFIMNLQTSGTSPRSPP